MAYIDYDTRDITFDSVIPKSYQIISVLMNYKRTVEDFKKCGGKAPTVYGLAFISDCVQSSTSVTCNNLKFPVPCGDGKCHSDYISCLRVSHPLLLLSSFTNSLPHYSLNDSHSLSPLNLC